MYSLFPQEILYDILNKIQSLDDQCNFIDIFPMIVTGAFIKKIVKSKMNEVKHKVNSVMDQYTDCKYLRRDYSPNIDADYPLFCTQCDELITDFGSDIIICYSKYNKENSECLRYFCTSCVPLCDLKVIKYEYTQFECEPCVTEWVCPSCAHIEGDHVENVYKPCITGTHLIKNEQGNKCRKCVDPFFISNPFTIREQSPISELDYDCS